MIDVSKIKVRCSSLHYLFTPPKAKVAKEAGELSETAKTHCVDLLTSHLFGRNEDTESKYTEKGNTVEESSITMVTLDEFRRTQSADSVFTKNDQRIEDDFISGEPDLFEGPSITVATRVRDIKSSWSIYTYMRSIHDDIKPAYWQQLQGYMRLTCAYESKLHQCLVNTDISQIMKELEKESWKHPERDTPNWREIEIISQHVFDKKTFDNYIEVRGCVPNDALSQRYYNAFVEIPERFRLYTRIIPRDNLFIDSIPTYVLKAREYIKNEILTLPHYEALHEKN